KGPLETAKNPVPRPPKPELKSQAKVAEPEAEATPTETSAASAAAECTPVLETASATDVESSTVEPMTPPDPSPEMALSGTPEANEECATPGKAIPSAEPASGHDSPAPAIPPAPAPVTHTD